MTLGGWIEQIITWGMFVGGCWALITIAKRRYGAYFQQLVSILSPSVPDEIMSRTPDPESSEPASDHRQTAPQADQTVADAPKLQPATLDTCKSLREHGYTREEARAFLRANDRTLDNNIWAAAKPALPADDDAFVTPYAGRVTKRSFYTDADFPYEEPKV